MLYHLNLISKNQVQSLHSQLKPNQINLLYGPSQQGKSTLIEAWLHGSSLKKRDLFKIVLPFSNLGKIDDWKYFLLQYILTQIISELRLKHPSIYEGMMRTFPSLKYMVQAEGESLSLKSRIQLPNEGVLEILKWISTSSFHCVVVLEDADALLDEAEIMPILESLSRLELVHFVVLSTSSNPSQSSSKALLNCIELPSFSFKKWKKKVVKVHTYLAKEKESDFLLENLFELFEGHVLYLNEVNDYLDLYWSSRKSLPTAEQIMDAILRSRIPLLKLIRSSLSHAQRNLLVAMAREEQKLYSKPILTHYELGTSANVARMKKVLEQKEILIEKQGQLYFIDPLVKHYFKMQSIPAFNRKDPR